MCTLHLNSQERQYGVFAPGRRVFGRAPEMPIGTSGNPNSPDFTHTVTAQVAQIHDL